MLKATNYRPPLCFLITWMAVCYNACRICTLLNLYPSVKPLQCISFHRYFRHYRLTEGTIKWLYWPVLYIICGQPKAGYISVILQFNIHSSGVSLHPTKKRIVYNFKSTFFAGMREITYKWYVSKEKKLIDGVPFTLSMMIWRTGKIDNTEWVYYYRTCHLFFRLYIPQKQQENWDLIHSSQGMIAINENIANRTMQSFCITESLSDELTECITFFLYKTYSI